jgi:hypothetical protein
MMPDCTPVVRSTLLLPGSLNDYATGARCLVWVVEVPIDDIDLGSLGFEGARPVVTDRSDYHPSTLFKIYLNG